jgi:hypothetical protein
MDDGILGNDTPIRVFRLADGNFQGEAQKFLGAGVTAVMVFAYIFDNPFKTLP